LLLRYTDISKGGIVRGKDATEGERLYIPQLGSTLLWAPLVQVDRRILAVELDLRQMVVETGCNPDFYLSREVMADHMIFYEQPLWMKMCAVDGGEIFVDSTTPVVGLGLPASGYFWGVGKWANGVIMIAKSTQEELEHISEGSSGENFTEE